MDKSYKEVLEENKKLKIELISARSDFNMISQMNTTMFRITAKRAAESITNTLNDREEMQKRSEDFIKIFEKYMEKGVF